MVVVAGRSESKAAALEWYSSPEYKDVLPIRLAATEGFGVACEGFVYPEG